MTLLVIDITELASHPGRSRPVKGAETIQGLKGVLGWVEDDDPVEVDLLAESLVDGIGVSGEVTGRLKLTCSRCLVGFEEPFRKSVDETFYFAPVSEDEGYKVEGTVIDLEQMLRDLIVLSIPMSPVHDEGCKGLCPVCGTDKNVSDCGHDSQPVDIRWAPLKGLFTEGGASEQEQGEASAST